MSGLVLVLRRILVCWILVLVLVMLALAGCQPAGATVIPTATSVPPTPTSTRVPVTATPTNTSEPAIHFDIPYVQGGHPKQKLHLYLPEDTGGPVPTVLVIRGLTYPIPGSEPVLAPRDGYDRLGRAFAEREYAAVLADYRYPNEPFQDQMTQDAFCALAWVQAYAGTYGMDVERIAVLGDDLGAAIAAKLVTVDDPGPFLESCPHPLSGPEGLKGIVTYGGDFLLPGPSLETGQRLMRIAKAYGLLTRVSYKELEGIFEVLRDLPAQDWRDNTELDQEAQEIARLLPLYWVTDSKHPTLLIDGAQDLLILEGGFRAQGAPVPPSQSDAYASELKAAGAQVDVLVLPDIAQDSVRGGESFAVVFEAIEAFTSQVLQ